MGLEKTPEEHIEKLVEGFREVRRVLRDDGVLFLNYGDKYNTEGGNYRGIVQGIKGEAGSTLSGGMKQLANKAYRYNESTVQKQLSQGNLLMLPARVALALQADGWILRDDIIWAKAISFCDKYSGSTMPESVNGWRWERHRIKVKAGWDKNNPHPSKSAAGKSRIENSGGKFDAQAEWIDCPGCEKCEANGGLVLRRGSWRCTKAHEHIFQFVKTNSYFCDMDAVKEDISESSLQRINQPNFHNQKGGPKDYGLGVNRNRSMRKALEGFAENPSGRNLRNVWAINPRGYKEAHYATYPEAIVEPCIKVATSQKGVCPKCGAQWARIVDSKRLRRDELPKEDKRHRPSQYDGVYADINGKGDAGYRETTTLGWKATCDCGIEETVPALVLDPFMGSGTTAVVAGKLNRNYFGVEINPEYKKNHIDVRIKEVETAVPKEESFAGQKALFE